MAGNIMDLDKLKTEYDTVLPKIGNFREAFIHEINHLLTSNGVSLAVPLESRVKSWSSIQEKAQRKKVDLSHITDLNDLIGVRIILLFKKDVTLTQQLIEKTFVIRDREDAAIRLDDAQFGYQSMHYAVSLPEVWMQIPSLKEFKGLNAELQVRTLPQHLWAAASHTLQYKNETTIPPSVRRSVYRLSALLEIVDLELDRVLQQRDEYLSLLSTGTEVDLNVDLLAAFLNDNLPSNNKSESEEYAELLANLSTIGIATLPELQNLFQKYLTSALKLDSEAVECIKQGNKPHKDKIDNIDITNKYAVDDNMQKRGVFYNHTGLVRKMIEFVTDTRKMNRPT